MAVQNAPERKEYQQVLNARKEPLYDLRPKVVTIDGQPSPGGKHRRGTGS